MLPRGIVKVWKNEPRAPWSSKEKRKWEEGVRPRACGHLQKEFRAFLLLLARAKRNI